MNYPEPVNQFQRLIHVSGPAVTGNYTYGSGWDNVAHGQNWDSRNCSAAVGAIVMDAQTGGRITTSPNTIRNNQDDWEGGIGWDDVNVAIGRKFPGHQLILPQAHDWYDVLASLQQRRFVAIQGDYDQVPFAYQAQKGGTFDHAFGLAGYRASDGRVLRYDPLAKKASWVPQSAIRGAAEKLALVQRGTKARLFVGLSRVMPPPYIPGVTYRYGGQPRFRGRYLARRDNVPVRSGPGTSYPKVAELDHRQDFAARQSTQNGAWLGTADGDKWVYREVVWYSGGITGSEDVQ